MSVPSGQPPVYQAPEGQPFNPAPPPPPPKRANPWKWLVLGCGGLVVLGICATVAITGGFLNSFGNSPTQAVSGGSGTTTGAALASVGQTATKGNWAVTLDKVERAQRVGTDTTAPQGIYVICYTTLKNVGKESYPLNSSDFTVTNNASGNKYKIVSAGTSQTLGAHKVLFLSQTVQPDLTAKTAVVFDVPTDAKELAFEVQGIKFAVPAP